MSSTIILPDSLLCVEEGNSSMAPLTSNGRNKLIVYIDSCECTKCRIENIVRYEKLFEQADNSHSFCVFYIIYVPEKSYTDILDFLILMELPYPVYLDSKGLFRFLNPLFPEDPRYHTIYSDQNGNPLLVGDPVHNPAVCTLFNELISGQI